MISYWDIYNSNFWISNLTTCIRQPLEHLIMTYICVVRFVKMTYVIYNYRCYYLRCAYLRKTQQCIYSLIPLDNRCQQICCFIISVLFFVRPSKWNVEYCRNISVFKNRNFIWRSNRRILMWIVIRKQFGNSQMCFERKIIIIKKPHSFLSLFFR